MRQLSWIARKGGLFFKIPRRSLDLFGDARSDSCRREIREEFHLLTLLAGLSDHVIRPVAFVEEYSCLVLPDLRAENLRDVLLSELPFGHIEPQSRAHQVGAQVAQATLRLAVGIIAGIHRQGCPEKLELRAVNYRENQWLPAPPGLAMPAQPVVVVDGYELRNLLLDSTSGEIYLVDPHAVGIGFPEEDLARLIVSLLMLNWGRHVNCRVWTGFDCIDLLQEYEKQSGRSLDGERLAYCFEMIVAMRFYHSNRSLKKIGNPLVRRIGRVYQKAFFYQVRRWGKQHGFEQIRG